MRVPHISTLIIDGMFLVKAIGNPNKDCRIFGNFVKMFLKVVFSYREQFERIQLIFDRYRKNFIKTATRLKRKDGKSVRRLIKHKDIPLPGGSSATFFTPIH